LIAATVTLATRLAGQEDHMINDSMNTSLGILINTQPINEKDPYLKMGI
jgi:hypothetical protein